MAEGARKKKFLSEEELPGKIKEQILLGKWLKMPDRAAQISDSSLLY